ncbi:MAG: diacylglycerol kinase family protein [Novosphingobium sp.]
MATIPFVINRKAGTAAATGEDLSQQLESILASNGADATVELVDGDKLEEAISRAAKGKARIAIGGGDGTLASAAKALAGSSTAFALLPLGTLNHLARDLSIPADLEQAVELALKGTAKAIDLGNVNGHRFVNNASIGLYPSMVALREEYRDRYGLPKWLASIPAAWSALSQLRDYRLELDFGEGPQWVVTPLLFIGNNTYSLEAGQVGTRASLSEGNFSVFAIKRRSKLALAWCGLRAIAGRADLKNDFVAIGECAQLAVASQWQNHDVGLDGELVNLDFPLDFRIEPAALQVICPAS